MDKIRLFLDMDGTAAEFNPVDTLETLYEKGYFLNLKPHNNVINAIKLIIKKYPEVEVFVHSSRLMDSKYALEEKNQWLDKYLPEIKKDHRIFPPCGSNKKDFVPDGIRSNDFLLDDYTKNLMLWQPPAKGIKLLNGLNHTRGTWQGSMLSYSRSAESLAEAIISVMKGQILRDKLPLPEKDNNRQSVHDEYQER